MVAGTIKVRCEYDSAKVNCDSDILCAGYDSVKVRCDVDSVKVHCDSVHLPFSPTRVDLKENFLNAYMTVIFLQCYICREM